MPARDRVREQVIAMALAFPMWGHRKIAWLCRHDATAVSDATCLRVLRDAGLVLPVDYVRERRDLAKGAPRGVRHDPDQTQPGVADGLLRA